VACLATPVYALDLMEAYEAALANDPAFRSALKESQAGEAGRVIGRSFLMPRLSGNYNWLQNDSKISGPAFTGGPTTNASLAYPSVSAGAQLTQPLFNLQALAQYRQAMALSDQSQAKFLYQTQDLLVRVLQAYTDLLYAHDDLSYLKTQRDAYKEQVKVNKRTLEKGEGTVTDQLESLSVYELSEAQVIEAEDSLENAKRKLEALIGYTLTSTDALKKIRVKFKPADAAPANYAALRDDALANNVELIAMRHQVEGARQDYLRNQSAHVPTVGMVAGWNLQQSNFVSSIYQNANTTSVGVQVSIPVFSGGEIAGRAAQSRANFEKVQADFDVLKNRVLIELRKQYDLVLSSQKRIAALERAVESSFELTKAMRSSVRGGVRINLDVLLAEKTLATAQRNLAQAKYNFMLANLKMRQQAGNLTLADLEKTALHFVTDKPK
jgi:outer membrane protein, protease secretion system